MIQEDRNNDTRSITITPTRKIGDKKAWNNKDRSDGLRSISPIENNACKTKQYTMILTMDPKLRPMTVTTDMA